MKQGKYEIEALTRTQVINSYQRIPITAVFPYFYDVLRNPSFYYLENWYTSYNQCQLLVHEKQYL
jgi:hypothetical protein